MAIHSSTIAWKIHGQRSVVSYSPWGRKESDTTERLHFHFTQWKYYTKNKMDLYVLVFLREKKKSQFRRILCDLCVTSESVSPSVVYNFVTLWT